jgi:hypothetical protein
MAYDHIVSMIDAQIAALNQAKGLLEGSEIHGRKEPARKRYAPRKKQAIAEIPTVAVTVLKPVGPPRRRMPRTTPIELGGIALAKVIPQRPVVATREQLRREAERRGQFGQRAKVTQPELNPEEVSRRWLGGGRAIGNERVSD